MQLNLLVGLLMATTGVTVVYGGLTGRLAAMIAALVKPQDLGQPGSVGAHGTPNVGTNADNAPDSNQLTLAQLIRQFNSLGLNKNADAKAAYAKNVRPLLVKARKGSADDYQAAITALRNLIATYRPNSVAPGTTAKSGGNLDSTTGRAPIIAPPLPAGVKP